MANRYDDNSFEVKFNTFKEQVMATGIPFDSLINFHQLLDILGPKVNDSRLGRDLVATIINHADKNMQQSFTLSQFFDAYVAYRRASLEKVESAQLQLSKLQVERTDAVKAYEQAKQAADLSNLYGEKPKGMLNIEINGIQGLQIPAGKMIYVKLNNYNLQFQTSTKQYNEQISWNEKFAFEIHTGFERIDVKVLGVPLSGRDTEELIGSSQVHVSSLRDQNFSSEWSSLYDGKSYAPVGRIKMGLQLISSKVEYLQKITERLDEHIALQIEEIEEFERSLKSLNTFISPLGFQSPQSPGPNFKNRIGSPKNHKGNSDHSLNDGSSEQVFKTILEEEDGESSNNSNLEIRTLEMSMNSDLYGVATAYQNLQTIQPKELVHKSLYSPEPTTIHSVKARNSPAPQSYSVTKFPESDIKPKNPIFGNLRSESPIIPNWNRTSTSLNYLGEPQSPFSPLKENPTNYDGSNKDMIINQLQKKLDDTTRENEKLKGFMNFLTTENQRLQVQATQAEGLTTKIQDYENKIRTLLSEVERLDKIASQSQQVNPVENKYVGMVPLKPNSDLEQNVKLLIDENLKLSKDLAKKSQEVAYWKQQAKDLNKGISPVHSPRIGMGGKNPMINNKGAYLDLGGKGFQPQYYDQYTAARPAKEMNRMFPDVTNIDLKKGNSLRSSSVQAV